MTSTALPAWTPEIERATRPLYERLRGVIPDVEWPVQYRQGKVQLERNLARAAAMAGERPEANG